MKQELDQARTRQRNNLAVEFAKHQIHGHFPPTNVQGIAEDAFHLADAIMARLHPEPPQVPSQQGHERFGIADAIAQEILMERGRQIQEEGYTANGDDAAYALVPREKQGQLAFAAGAYAAGAGYVINGNGPEHVFELWPWNRDLFKIDSARRMLVKAAALIMAQLEQIDRIAAGEISEPMRVGSEVDLVEKTGLTRGHHMGARKPTEKTQVGERLLAGEQQRGEQRIEKYPPGIAKREELPDVAAYPIGTTYRGWESAGDGQGGKQWVESF